jgi:hypothetical protein
MLVRGRSLAALGDRGTRRRLFTGQAGDIELAKDRARELARLGNQLTDARAHLRC